MFVSAMRRLDGQVYSYNDAKRLNVLPGSRVIDKRELNNIHSDLVKGLCLLEGCLPISHLNPGLHHFVHYAQYTRLLGLTRWYWMLCFERCVHSYAHTYMSTPSLTPHLHPPQFMHGVGVVVYGCVWVTCVHDACPTSLTPHLPHASPHSITSSPISRLTSHVQV